MAKKKAAKRQPVATAKKKSAATVSKAAKPRKPAKPPRRVKAAAASMPRAAWAMACAPANNPPSLTAPMTMTCHPGHTIFAAFHGFDPDFDTLTYSAQSPSPFPPTAVLDSTTGLLTFSPDGSTPPGPNSFTVRVDDGKGGSATATWQVNVVDQPPNFCVNGPLPPAHPGKQYTCFFNATDPEGDQLEWLKASGPGAVDATNGKFQFTPAWSDAGTIVSVQVEVRQVNRHSNNAVATFQISVVNNPPQVQAFSPPAGTVGNPVNFDVQAPDPEGDTPLNPTATQPAGVSFSLKPGKTDEWTASWTPTSAGTFPVTIRVNDPDPRSGVFGERSASITVT